VPKSEQPKYMGWHKYTSQNVMACCDFDTRFTFVVTGWPGSAHDTRVFLDTLVTYKDNFPHPPQGKYYLVDSGYPNSKGYLAPYKGQRYHVPEWQHNTKWDWRRRQLSSCVPSKRGWVIIWNFKNEVAHSQENT
jgi:hypothetical protein